MGRHTVRFRCHSCGHCCTEVVCLPTPWDVIRIVRDIQVDPHKFLVFLGADEISEVEDDDPTWLTVRGKKYIMGLRRGAKGCFFLDKKDRTCTIYDSRPLLCRLYPFCHEETRAGKHLGFSLHTDVGCPRHRDGVVPVEPLKALLDEEEGHRRDYEDLVKVFNRREYPGKAPKDFIGLFVEVQSKKKAPKTREN